jgi:WD40 repeat protein
VSISLSGIIRIWSTDFENLKSEVKTGTQVNTCDINYDCNQICVLSTQNKSISILDLESSSYNVVLRSHSDNLIDVSHNLMTGKLVTIGDDYCVKVWHADTMEQLNEFVSENDLPIRVVCQNQGFLGEGVTSEHSDSLVAIGFKSGFLRVLDLDSMTVVHETMLF